MNICVYYVCIVYRRVLHMRLPAELDSSLGGSFTNTWSRMQCTFSTVGSFPLYFKRMSSSLIIWWLTSLYFNSVPAHTYIHTYIHTACNIYNALKNCICTHSFIDRYAHRHKDTYFHTYIHTYAHKIFLLYDVHLCPILSANHPQLLIEHSLIIH